MAKRTNLKIVPPRPQQRMIEKGIPVPTGTAHSHRRKFPELFDMVPGDSVLFSEEDVSSLRMAVQYVQRKRQWRYAIRSTDDGARIWRLS
jgi:hypothetical protein